MVHETLEEAKTRAANRANDENIKIYLYWNPYGLEYFTSDHKAHSSQVLLDIFYP